MKKFKSLKLEGAPSSKLLETNLQKLYNLLESGGFNDYYSGYYK